MARKMDKGMSEVEPQKSSAAQFLTYIASTGTSGEKYEIRYENENIWMSQKMLAAVYGVDLRTINYHVNKVFRDAELDRDRCIQKYWIHLDDGRNYEVAHYNLQVIIAIGFKINNERAVQFRKWANQIVSEYTVKGWVLDDQRLKDGTPLGDRYFEHLLARIREIRLSERKFYQKITDLYATAVDYDKTAQTTRHFFATVQNRMHVAVHGHTAAQLIYTRADAEKEHMGLTTWAQAPDGKIMKSDVAIAKNYLSGEHMRELNRIVEAYINLAETRAKNHRPTTMQQWAEFLDNFLTLASYPILMDKGKVSALQAKLKAYEEYDKYRVVQDRMYLSDFDKEVKRLKGEMGIEE